MTDETPKKKAAAELPITTWYFAPSEPDEWRICSAYMKAKRSEEYKEGLLLNELNLAQLNPQDAVVIVGRHLDGRDVSPVRPVRKHELNGQTFDEYVAYDTLIGEVSETSPLFVNATHKEPDGNGGYASVSSYWQAVQGRHRQGGSLKRPEFLAALGAKAAPLCFRFQDGNSVHLPNLPIILTLHVV